MPPEDEQLVCSKHVEDVSIVKYIKKVHLVVLLRNVTIVQAPLWHTFVYNYHILRGIKLFSDYHGIC